MKTCLAQGIKPTPRAASETSKDLKGDQYYEVLDGPRKEIESAECRSVEPKQK